MYDKVQHNDNNATVNSMFNSWSFCLITDTKFDALESWHQIHGEMLLYPFLQEKSEAQKVKGLTPVTNK